jgi:hypothetical protein
MTATSEETGKVSDVACLTKRRHTCKAKSVQNMCASLNAWTQCKANKASILENKKTIASKPMHGRNRMSNKISDLQYYGQDSENNLHNWCMNMSTVTGANWFH